MKYLFILLLILVIVIDIVNTIIAPALTGIGFIVIALILKKSNQSTP